MNPQDNQSNGQVGVPDKNQGIYSRQSVTPPARNSSAQQEAAANLIRGQLDNIYSGNSGEDTPHTTPAVQPAPQEPVQLPTQPQPQTEQSATPVAEPVVPPTSNHGLQTTPPASTTPAVNRNPYNNGMTSTYKRTMSTEFRPSTTKADSKGQWQEYHDAWQKYYQLYYQRYYMGNLYSQQQKPTEATGVIATSTDGSLSQNEAMKELRESIRQKVSSSAEKAKKSRHFVPIVAGLVVLVFFLFVQYNRVVFGAVAAYTTPGNIEPQNIIADPMTDIKVGPESRMIIPKINIDAPVIYGIGPDYNSQMTAMEKGIAHFSIPGANAIPGQVGNAVFAGHSSNDVFAQGDYKFIFAQNEKLTKGDIIYMNYGSKRYTYSVTSTEVVMPDEVSKVQLQTDKPMLTLVSCVPLGTAQKRLLVFAEQISPDPGGATASADSKTAPAADTIPGKPAPTLIEKIFGAS